MAAGIIFKDEKFKRDLTAWSHQSKRILADSINNFIGDVALTASSREYTKEASLGAIDQLGTRIESNKTKLVDAGGGKRKRVVVGSKWKTSPDVGTFKLANWIMKNQGLPPLGHRKQGIPGRGFGGKMAKSGKAGTIATISRNLLQARKFSIGYIRKGWWAAAMAVGKTIKAAEPIAVSRIGGGQKAVENAGTFRASIFNNAGSYDIRYFPEQKRNISGAKLIGEAGLTRAVNDNIQKFYRFISTGLRKEWKNPTKG